MCTRILAQSKYKKIWKISVFGKLIDLFTDCIINEDGFNKAYCIFCQCVLRKNKIH
jgi:hypothetical protein